jgi:hypothetical protein
MEVSKQSWVESVSMPLPVFQKYLKWKSDLLEEQKKQIEEEQDKIRVRARGK